MSLLTVDVSGKKFVVDSANKGTAKAWGREKLEVTVTEATAAEVTDFLSEGNTIEKLESKSKAAPVAAAPAAETAAA